MGGGVATHYQGCTTVGHTVEGRRWCMVTQCQLCTTVGPLLRVRGHPVPVVYNSRSTVEGAWSPSASCVQQWVILLRVRGHPVPVVYNSRSTVEGAWSPSASCVQQWVILLRVRGHPVPVVYNSRSYC